MTHTPQSGDKLRSNDSVITLTMDLGPGKDLADLSELVQHLTEIVDLGVELHARTARLQSLQELLPALDEEGSIFAIAPILGADWVERMAFSVNRDFARVVREHLRERELIVAVDQLTYQNPFSLQLSLSLFSDAFVQVLKVIRDWSADKRIRKAQADDFESAIRARERLRQRVLDQLEQDGSPLPPGLVADLLTPKKLEAIDSVAGAAPEITANYEALPD